MQSWQHPKISSTAHLELAAVHAVIALDERVSQVVDAEALQPGQGSVVEVQVVRVAHVVRCALRELVVVGLQHCRHLPVELLRQKGTTL